MVLVCCEPLPRLLTPEQARISVEMASKERSEWLHMNCQPLHSALLSDSPGKLDSNARVLALREGADIVSIINQSCESNEGIIVQCTWDVMLYKYKNHPSVVPDSGSKDAR